MSEMLLKQKMSGDTPVVIIPTSLKDRPFIKVIRKDDYGVFRKLIGCRCFDVVELDDLGDVSIDCYIDDEGRLDGAPINEYWDRAFKKGKIRCPLYGITVIAMTEHEEGETCDTDLVLVKRTLKQLCFRDSELKF